jgi:hypothetical protein
MQRTCEEAKTQESARGGAGPLGWPSSERGQETRQQTKRPQGWSGQKPQEDYCRPTQRSPATTRTPQERMSAAVASIRPLRRRCDRSRLSRNPVCPSQTRGSGSIPSRISSMRWCRATIFGYSTIASTQVSIPGTISSSLATLCARVNELGGFKAEQLRA